MHVQQHHVALRHYMTSIQRSTWPLLGIYWIPTVGLVPVPVRQSMERQVYLYSTFPTQRQNNVLYINKSTRNIPKRKNYNHKNQRLRSRVTCRDFVCEQHGLSESGVGKGSPASVGLFLPNPAPFFTEILLHIWLRSCSIFDWGPALPGSLWITRCRRRHVPHVFILWLLFRLWICPCLLFWILVFLGVLPSRRLSPLCSVSA